MKLVSIGVVHILLIVWCTFWPIRNCLWKKSLSLKNYTLGNSNWDIFVLTSFFYLIETVIYYVVAFYAKRNKFNERTHKIIQILADVTYMCFCFLLIAKSTVVAILSEGYGKQGGVFFAPKDCSKYSGLLWIYAAIISGIICFSLFSKVQKQLFVKIKEKQQAVNRDEEQPLLRDENQTQNPKQTETEEPETQPETEAQKQQKERTVRKFLFRAIIKEWKFYIPAYLAGGCAAVFNAAIDYYTGKVLDATIGMVYQHLFYYLMMLSIVGILFAVLSSTRGCLFVAATGGLTRTFRQDLFFNLIKQENAFFDVTRTGDINSRLSSDVQEITDMFTLNLNILFRSIFQIVTVLAFMFGTSWRLTMVTFVIIPMIAIICQVYGKYYQKLVKQAQNAAADSSAVAEEAISAISTVRAHAAEATIRELYRKNIQKYVNCIFKQSIAYFFYTLLNNGLPVCLLIVVLLYGGHLVFQDELSKPGWLVSFILYEKSLMSAFQLVGDVYSGLVTAYGASEKVIEMTSRKTKIDPTSRGRKMDLLFGRIQFKNVTFSYPSRPHAPILKNFNMDVRPGEVVALVGPSGSGKSSVIRLLQRSYLPSAGNIYIDGWPIDGLDQKWLKRNIALVSQEPVLFNWSIKDNILLGLQKEDEVGVEYTQDQVEFAAIQANADSFIEAFPDKYDTICGEKGAQLSGGQKQRIAIARALVRRPSILLLDEATSALDGESEAVVQDALEKVMVGRTVIVIAHRLSTVVNCDRILVVSDGAVVEQGNHGQLIKIDGLYKQLVRAQLPSPLSQKSLIATAQDTTA